MTTLRHWPRLSELKPARPPDPDPPETIAEQFIKAMRKAKGEAPPALPPEGSPARAIVDAMRKARGQK